MTRLAQRARLGTNVPWIGSIITTSVIKNPTRPTRKTALGECRHRGFGLRVHSGWVKSALGFSGYISTAWMGIGWDWEALQGNTVDAIIRFLRNPIRTQKSRVSRGDCLQI